MRRYTQLTQEQRYQIYALMKAEHSQTGIAAIGGGCDGADRTVPGVAGKHRKAGAGLIGDGPTFSARIVTIDIVFSTERQADNTAGIVADGSKTELYRMGSHDNFSGAADIDGDPENRFNI